MKQTKYTHINRTFKPWVDATYESLVEKLDACAYIQKEIEERRRERETCRAKEAHKKSEKHEAKIRPNAVD